MSLGRLSVMQAVDVWSDLARAYYGDNSYGSDTAEIYAYRIAPYRPSVHSPRSDFSIPAHDPSSKDGAEYRRANAETMVDLLHLFAEAFDAEITVRGERFDWEPLCEWIKGQGFDHRWHIRVRPKRPA